MKNPYTSIEDLIKQNLNTRNEDAKTALLIEELKTVKIRGYFNKDDFMKMCLWKSPRPKPQYLKNTEENIMGVSKRVFKTIFEKQKIDLLTSLKGVSIPAASAILTLTDPADYGVIDIRVWQVLYSYGSVRTKPKGIGFSFKNWFTYLSKLRYFAKKFDVNVRDIERTLFLYHKDTQEGNLYK